MRSSVESCSTVRSWLRRAARSCSPSVAGGGGGGGGASGSLACSLSSAWVIGGSSGVIGGCPSTALLRLELCELGRAWETVAQLRRAAVGRRCVVERALHVD